MAKRLAVRLDDYHEEALAMLRARFPGRTDSDAIRELLATERIRQEGGQTKDAKLDRILALCESIQSQLGSQA